MTRILPDILILLSAIALFFGLVAIYHSLRVLLMPHNRGMRWPALSIRLGKHQEACLEKIRSVQREEERCVKGGRESGSDRTEPNEELRQSDQQEISDVSQQLEMLRKEARRLIEEHIRSVQNTEDKPGDREGESSGKPNCRSCGTHNDGDAVYCKKCGSRMAAEDAKDRS